MFPSIITACISIFVYFPDSTYATRMQYESMIQDAFKTYEYVGVTYRYTKCVDSADVVIRTNVIILHDGYIGYCNGSIKTNRKFQPQPEILISKLISLSQFEIVLRHELYHYLTGLAYHNEYDQTSLMYPEISQGSHLTRIDSLILSKHFLNENRIEYIMFPRME